MESREKNDQEGLGMERRETQNMRLRATDERLEKVEMEDREGNP